MKKLYFFLIAMLAGSSLGAMLKPEPMQTLEEFRQQLAQMSYYFDHPLPIPTCLMESARRADVEGVSVDLDHIDANLQDTFGRTALTEATTGFDMTPFAHVCMQPRVKKIIELLLEKGAYIDHQTINTAESALINVTKAGYPDCVRLLLERGAHPDLLDGDCKTALMHAVTYEGDPEDKNKMIHELLSHGAIPTLKRGMRPSALELAQQQGASSAPIVQRMNELIVMARMLQAQEFSDQANIAAAGNADVPFVTPLLIRAVQYGPIGIQAALNSGACVYDEDEHGRNALIHAVRTGDEQMVVLLIKAGCNINHRDKGLVTPLIAAVNAEALAPQIRARMMRLLCKEEVEVDAQELSGGSTALMDAVCMGALEPIQVLLKAKANVNMKNNMGMTALTYAMNLDPEQGHINTETRKEIIRELLRHGANPSIRNNENCSPLDFAREFVEDNQEMNIAKLLCDEQLQED